MHYIANQQPQHSDEDSNLVGFGKHPKKTWREVWESRADGYAAFILQQECRKNTKMHKLQQYLAKKQSGKPTTASARATAPAPTPVTAKATAPATPLATSTASAPPLTTATASAPLPVTATASASLASHLPGLLTVLMNMSTLNIC